MNLYDRIKKLTHCHRSLTQAVDAAGGAPESFSLSALDEMTALDFLTRICTNNIRFVYLKTDDD